MAEQVEIICTRCREHATAPLGSRKARILRQLGLCGVCVKELIDGEEY